MIWLPGLVDSHVVASPVSRPECEPLGDLRLRAAFRSSTASSGNGSVRLDAFDLSVPVSIQRHMATLFSAMRIDHAGSASAPSPNGLSVMLTLIRGARDLAAAHPVQS